MRTLTEVRRRVDTYGDKSYIRAVLNDAFVAYELETMFADDMVSIKANPFSVGDKDNPLKGERAVLELFDVNDKVKFRLWDSKNKMPMSNERIGRVIHKHSSIGSDKEQPFVQIVIQFN